MPPVQSLTAIDKELGRQYAGNNAPRGNQTTVLCKICTINSLKFLVVFAVNPISKGMWLYQKLSDMQSVILYWLFDYLRLMQMQLAYGKDDLLDNSIDI